jgi:hypothetical protein
VSVAPLVILIVPPLPTALTVKSAVPLVVVLAEVGLIAIDEIARKTVAVAVAVTLCEATVIVAVPFEMPLSVAAPVPVTVATDGSELDHDTFLVRFPLVLSLLTPNACTVTLDPT